MQFLQELFNPLLSEKQIQVHILRLDLVHPTIGGNKYFKLKYNLSQAKQDNKQTILSFGGAYSNHIASLAAAGKEFGLSTIGVIRGDELTDDSNPTLKTAKKNGMQFYFVDRDTYRKKNESAFIIELKKQFGDFYLIPEGGSNTLAVKGCTEIVDLISIKFDTLICACGTGGTIAGVALSLKEWQQAIGIVVLKGAEFLEEEIRKLQSNFLKINNNFSQVKLPKLIHDYHFGAYAKTTPDLLAFKQIFENEFQIPLDKIYTSKLMYAFFDLLKKGRFVPGTRIVLVHTGGLQGN